MKRVTPTRSTTRSNILFTKDGVRASMVTRYWPWVLGWHESVVGTLMSPELLDVGPAEAVPDVVLVPTCSVVRSVPGPPVPWVGNVGLGCVVGDMTSTSRAQAGSTRWHCAGRWLLGLYLGGGGLQGGV